MKGPAEYVKKYPDKKSFGEIYIQVIFFKDNDTRLNTKPPALLQDLRAEQEAQKAEEERAIVGTVLCRILTLSDLLSQGAAGQNGYESETETRVFIPNKKS